MHCERCEIKGSKDREWSRNKWQNTSEICRWVEKLKWLFCATLHTSRMPSILSNIRFGGIGAKIENIALQVVTNGFDGMCTQWQCALCAHTHTHTPFIHFFSLGGFVFRHLVTFADANLGYGRIIFFARITSAGVPIYRWICILYLRYLPFDVGNESSNSRNKMLLLSICQTNGNISPVLGNRRAASLPWIPSADANALCMVFYSNWGCNANPCQSRPAQPGRRWRREWRRRCGREAFYFLPNRHPYWIIGWKVRINQMVIQMETTPKLNTKSYTAIYLVDAYAKRAHSCS